MVQSTLFYLFLTQGAHIGVYKFIGLDTKHFPYSLSPFLITFLPVAPSFFSLQTPPIISPPNSQTKA